MSKPRQMSWPLVLVCLFTLVYTVYFSVATIYRMNHQSAHLFDLGIMHQTTYNTYRSLATLDFGRFLELTDPYGPNQIKRMAIHNDIILAVLAPFYFIYSGPETLLVIQAAVLGMGAVVLFLIGRYVMAKVKYAEWISLGIALAYLLNPLLGFINLFEFHGVALATTFLLAMVYFWLIGKWRWSLVFLGLSLLTKEQVSLTTAFFGLYIAYRTFLEKKPLKAYWFAALVFCISVMWFLLSLKVIIPMSRGGTDHFALDYYGEFGNSPTDVVLNVLKNPVKGISYILNADSLDYLNQLFLPVGFLPFLAPFVLAIGAPEFGVTLLSNNDNMRNIIYHYQAVHLSFIFLGTLYALVFLYRVSKRWQVPAVAAGVVMLLTVYSAWDFGPLPSAKNAQTYMFGQAPENTPAVRQWMDKLRDERYVVVTTGKLAPFFSSRRYYYIMSDRYTKADYIIVNPQEVYSSYGKEWAIPAYEKLQGNPIFDLIYEEPTLRVYQRKTLD